MESRYDLQINVLEKLRTDNTPPYFADWSSYSPAQFTAQNGIVKFPLPTPLDDEEDELEMSIDFMGENFATWDESNNEIILNLDFAVSEPQEFLAAVKLDDFLDAQIYLWKYFVMPNQAPEFPNWNKIQLLSIKEKQGLYELDLSNYSDPEGDEVILKFDLLQISGFAYFNEGDIHTLIIDTDAEDILGTHEAKAILTDEHGNTSKYVLIVEITSKEDPSSGSILNSPPYFDKKKWEKSIPV